MVSCVFSGSLLLFKHRDLDRDGEPTKAFELLVWATVISRPAEYPAIVYGGVKTLAFDSGPPIL